eukprot:3933911-Rhodomonas_salina.2
MPGSAVDEKRLGHRGKVIASFHKSNVVRTTRAHPHSGRFLNHLDFPSIGRGQGSDDMGVHV